jgi:hypothetical protein
MDIDQLDSVDNNPRVRKGLHLIEQLWWQLAKQIVKKAGELYKWDDDQWRDMQELFLRPNDYKAVLKLEE